MAVATSMALGVAPCVAPSIAHRSTLSVLSVLNGLRLRGKAARQLLLSSSQGVGQRLGGLAHVTGHTAHTEHFFSRALA